MTSEALTETGKLDNPISITAIYIRSGFQMRLFLHVDC